MKFATLQITKIKTIRLMKNLIAFFIFSILMASCKNEPKKEIQPEKYPSELKKVFDAHGGIPAWRNVQTLSFNKGEEIHTVDLHSRKTVINTPKYSLGFDGEDVWLDEVEKGIYKGNPTFYYNLYFYFYAMPFVLADDGIIYEKVDDLVFEGINYPGYKISFKANVGTSSDDNYKVYYNSETYQMEWLAYTVTFNSKKPSDSYHIINYNKWENVNGLLLPKAITWYKQDSIGAPTEPRGIATEFTLPLVSNTKISDSFFDKPVK